MRLLRCSRRAGPCAGGGRGAVGARGQCGGARRQGRATLGPAPRALNFCPWPRPRAKFFVGGSTCACAAVTWRAGGWWTAAAALSSDPSLLFAARWGGAQLGGRRAALIEVWSTSIRPPSTWDPLHISRAGKAVAFSGERVSRGRVWQAHGMPCPRTTA